MKRFFLLLSLASWLAMPSYAQLVQTTGSLNTMRTSHQSQALLNGQILAFGGQNGGVLASAELYNPSTELWTLTDDMVQPRAQFASAMLDDGMVLAIGGSDGNGETSSCELYDPATGKWAATGSLSVNTSFPSAVKLQDGRVMMSYVTTCEIYHPDSATWYPAASLSEQRSKLILLPDGKVLSAGLSLSAEVYDPATDSWTAVSNNMTGATTGANGFSLLGDGRVLIVGGVSTSTIYDPASNAFQPAQDMLINLNQPSSISMENGNVLLFGTSASTNATDTKTIQVYNASANQWYSDSYSFNGPNRSRLHLMGNGDVLSVGGNAPLGGLSPNCYLISARVAAVSIEANVLPRPIRLFPNPTQDLLQVEWTEHGSAQMNLLDLQGRLILQTELTETNTQLSLGHLPRGIYVYQIRSARGLWSGRVSLK